MGKILELAESLKPAFAQEKIRNLEETGISWAQDFIVEEEWENQVSVPVAQIVGTQHQDYIGLTWLAFLHQGKRMRANHQLFDHNPGYYLEDGMKMPVMSFIEMDGRFYVEADGNHRSCIAKFYFASLGREKLDGVCVRRYRIDYTGHKAFKLLQKELKSFPFVFAGKTRTIVEREDRTGWKKDRYRTQVWLRNNLTGQELALTPSEIQEVFQAIRGAGWRQRFFPRTPLEKILWGRR